eukprot:1146501-Pelagomonas_calceolata.AAC.4
MSPVAQPNSFFANGAAQTWIPAKGGSGSHLMQMRIGCKCFMRLVLLDTAENQAPHLNTHGPINANPEKDNLA